MPRTKRLLHWPATDGFAVAAVGASYYREAIESISGNHDGENALVLCCATLVLEDENAFDPNAVAVYISEKKVGHLDRSLASQLREYLTAQGLLLKATTCDAAITGGLRTEEKEYSYTIELDLPLPFVPPDYSRPTYPESEKRSPSPVFYWRESGWCLVETRMPFHARADYRRTVDHWTADHWDTVNFYLQNSQGIGLGHKLFSISKSQVQEMFGGIPESDVKLIHGSTIFTELKKAHGAVE